MQLYLAKIPIVHYIVPLLNILEMLMVANVYHLHALKFSHAWHKGVFPELFNHFFQYASNVHNYNTRYAAKQNLHKFRVNTNISKQMISFTAIDLWQELPLRPKSISFLQKCQKLYSISTISNVSFHKSKSVENYLLSNSFSFII